MLCTADEKPTTKAGTWGIWRGCDDMLYFISDAGKPMKYISCGNLTSKDGFVHPRRNIDSFVLIIVIKGILHIRQNMSNFDVKEDEFILLFPDTLHYGYRPSDGNSRTTGFISRSMTRTTPFITREVFCETGRSLQSLPILPPRRIFCCLNMAAFLWKDAPGCCSSNCLISTSVKTMWQPGDVIMPSICSLWK